MITDWLFSRPKDRYTHTHRLGGDWALIRKGSADDDREHILLAYGVERLYLGQHADLRTVLADVEQLADDLRALADANPE